MDQVENRSREGKDGGHLAPRSGLRCLPFLPWLLGSQLSLNLGLHLPYCTARSKVVQGLCALGAATERSSSFLWRGVDSVLVPSGRLVFDFFVLFYLCHV